MERVADVGHRELELDGCRIFKGLHNDGCCAVVIAGEEFVDKLRVYAPRADAEEEAEAEPRKCPEDLGVLEMELRGRGGHPIRALSGGVERIAKHKCPAAWVREETVEQLDECRGLHV